MSKKECVIVTNEGVPFLSKGQMWLYTNNVANIDNNIANGSAVDIVDEAGNYYGSGLISKQSHIYVRILSKNRAVDFDRAFFKKRLKFAMDYRFMLEGDNFDNCRLIYGEADELPGLVVDRYNDVVVCQISTFGMEQIKPMLYELVVECLKEYGVDIKGIYERNDIAIRTKEGLEQYKGWYGEPYKTETIISENGLKLRVDIENGQKTGYFLDQKRNRYILRQMSKNKRVLDCFSHTGGFALNAALGGASHVVAVDVSQTALDQGYYNATLNGIEKKIDFVQADVFDYLDALAVDSFDIIVLDPPAFTKSRATVNKAYGGYKNINLKAMKALRQGGYLITCSCSRFMEIENFEKMLREAASEANVVLKQVSITQQNADHPILWNMAETSYLKFYVFQVVAVD